MIPNVFVSSTIADLRYLRDGVREAIEELSYRPVMSEHGEIGYLNPNTAAESCYRSMPECQLAVFIIGLRYGSVGQDGVSVTHNEFRAAKKADLPILTFVEPKVLSYKDVFDAEPEAALWTTFKAMDNPRQTFQFLDEIKSSERYNAIIPFGSAAETKRLLKLQLADYVGMRLSEGSRISGSQMRDLLAELKTLRNQFVHKGPDAGVLTKDSKKFLIAARFLLNEPTARYREFLSELFGDLDRAIEIIAIQPDLNGVLKDVNIELSTVEQLRAKVDTLDVRKRVKFGRTWADGGYIFLDKYVLIIAQETFNEFDALQKTLNESTIKVV